MTIIKLFLIVLIFFLQLLAGAMVIYIDFHKDEIRRFFKSATQFFEKKGIYVMEKKIDDLDSSQIEIMNTLNDRW